MIDLEEGLSEIFHVFDAFTDNGTDLERILDFSKGILQSIGYKEFYDYYVDQHKQTQDGTTLVSAKERLCSKTLSYAQYQMKWLRKRILPIFKAEREDKQNLMHQIVLNDPREYEAVAVGQGTAFVKQMIQYYAKTDAFSLETYAEHFLEFKANRFASWKKFTCELCGNMELNGQLELDKHLKTRKHRNNKCKASKAAGTGGNDKEFYAQKNSKRAAQKQLRQEQVDDDGEMEATLLFDHNEDD